MTMKIQSREVNGRFGRNRYIPVNTCRMCGHEFHRHELVSVMMGGFCPSCGHTPPIIWDKEELSNKFLRGCVLVL